MCDIDTDKLWQEFKKDNNLNARNELVLYYIPLVKYIINRLLVKTNNSEYEDVMSQGILGLIDSLEKYDISKGIKFETYATYRIKGAVIDYFRKKDWLPRSMRKKCMQLKSILDKNEDIDEKKIISELGVTEKEYCEILNYVNMGNILSLDELINKGNFSLPDDGATIEDLAEKNERKLLLEKYINKLSAREKIVLSLYYVDELTYKEIASVLGVTESRISQIHSKIIKKLREFFVKNT